MDLFIFFHLPHVQKKLKPIPFDFLQIRLVKGACSVNGENVVFYEKGSCISYPPEQNTLFLSQEYRVYSISWRHFFPYDVKKPSRGGNQNERVLDPSHHDMLHVDTPHVAFGVSEKDQKEKYQKQSETKLKEFNQKMEELKGKVLGMRKIFRPVMDTKRREKCLAFNHIGSEILRT